MFYSQGRNIRCSRNQHSIYTLKSLHVVPFSKRDCFGVLPVSECEHTSLRDSIAIENRTASSEHLTEQSTATIGEKYR